MKGFEIKINNEDTIFVSSDRMVCIFIDVEDISITGLDSMSNHLIWLRKGLKLGDKIIVKVTEIDKVSPFQNKYPTDRNELKRRYVELKKELETKGLI